MNVIINATKVRQNFFDILAATKNKNQVTKISLNGSVVAKIVPEEKKGFNWAAYEKRMKKIMKNLRKNNWEDVLEVRKKSQIKENKRW